MARTLTEIKNLMKVSFMNNEKLAEAYAFDLGADFDSNFSLVSIERIFVDIFAFGSWTLENLFNLHRTEVSGIIANMKPHSLRWYRTKAMQFQKGYALVTDSDVYDNSNLTEEQITASKIIKYCAVNEAQNESRLIIKIATEDADGVLAPIEPDEEVAFKHYLSEVKDAGNTITVTNYLPDILELEMIIHYDPLLFATDGSLLLDGNRPVESAINSFLKSLPFNGVLQLPNLVAALQAVDGVEIPQLVSASSAWINPVLGGYGDQQPIEVFKIPESGYFRITDFTNITYEPYG